MSDEVKAMMPPRFVLKDVYKNCQLTSTGIESLVSMWYDEHILPMFKNSRVVYGMKGTLDWSTLKSPIDTHIGLLINVTTTKEQTAVDILNELLKLAEDCKGDAVVIPKSTIKRFMKDKK